MTETQAIQGNEASDVILVDPEPGEPEKPPFKIAHLELPDIFRTIGAVLPLTKGRPATIETMEWAFRPVPPANLPEGVTPEIALDCVLWAIEINNQRKADKARHMAAGATIGYGAHLVKSRFRIVSERLFRRRKTTSNRATMQKSSRKANRR